MPTTIKDFSQLSWAVLVNSAQVPTSATPPLPAAATALKTERAAADRVRAEAEKFAAEEALRAEAERRAEKLESELQAAKEAHARDRETLRSLQGECARLKGELAQATAPRAQASLTSPAAKPPEAGTLALPADFDETFPGELREVILAALAEARDTAKQSARERRAAVLDAVLARNRSGGELERRRAALRQILKDAGDFTDVQTLADLKRLGFKVISGKKHWKLEYATVRIAMAKTPSDYRACLNLSQDMANRCF